MFIFKHSQLVLTHEEKCYKEKPLRSSVVSIFSVSSAGRYLLYSLTYFPGVFKVNQLRLPTFTSNMKLSGEWTTCTRVETLSGDRLASLTANTFIFIFITLKKRKNAPIFYYLFWHFDYGGKKTGASSMSYIYGPISILQAYRREEAECVIPGKAVKQPVIGWQRRRWCEFVAILCRTLK